MLSYLANFVPGFPPLAAVVLFDVVWHLRNSVLLFPVLHSGSLRVIDRVVAVGECVVDGVVEKDVWRVAELVFAVAVGHAVDLLAVVDSDRGARAKNAALCGGIKEKINLPRQFRGIGMQRRSNA
jgi:hypothetical protein